jgi:hypothetical protein
MKLNHFQQLEVDSHKDPELLWVIQESIEQFRADKTNFSEDRKFNRYSLYKKVGTFVNDTISEREGFRDNLHKLSQRESADMLWDSFKEQYPDEKNPQQWTHWDDLVYPFLDALVYKSLLRTRVPLVEKYDDGGYWPFGNEGGFCNPMKLKMMDD